MRIYLDWNATAPLLPEVRQAIIDALEVHGNASSIHQEGQASRSIVERARRSVARAIGAPAQGVVFTGGATEGNNQVLRHHVHTTEAAHIVCSAIEHPSVLATVEDLGRGGVQTTVVAVDRQGRIDLDRLRDAAANATLVSVMLANNETGNVYPIAEISAIAHDGGALMHVDATQALGRVPVDFGASGADYMTLSLHKTGGPKGIGIIAVREGLTIESGMTGGHQERGRRPGTENVPGVAGAGALAEAVARHVDEWSGELARLRARFVAALESEVGVEVRGDREHHLPNTVNAAFEGVDGEDLLLALDLEGIAASSGSACTAGSVEPSGVILAMGYEPDDARRSIRFSFGPTTTEADIDTAASTVAAVVRRLQRTTGGR